MRVGPEAVVVRGHTQERLDLVVHDRRIRTVAVVVGPGRGTGKGCGVVLWWGVVSDDAPYEHAVLNL